MTKEYTREQDEQLLAAMSFVEEVFGFEVRFSENERPSMLADLMQGSFEAMDRAFWKLVGGLP